MPGIEEGRKMKRFIKKFLLFCVPFVLALGFFFAFEIYDYWCVKGDCAYLSRGIHSLREVELTKPDKIILGDSRMANFNTDYIKEISGEDWCMMAYGGATLNESIEQFWYAVEHTELKEVVFGVNFYTMNDNHLAADRFPAAKEIAEHPLKYVMNFRYWMDAVYRFWNNISNAIYDATGWEAFYVFVDDPSSLEQDVRPPEEVNEEGYRVDLFNYSALIYNQCLEYKGSVEYLFRLQEIVDYCDSNDIQITFVIPASNRTLWDKVIYPLGLDFYIDIYKDTLKSMADVIDMEFYNDYAKNDDYFLDGFHFVLEEKLHLARIVFADEECEYAMRTTKEEYLAMKEAGETFTVALEPAAEPDAGQEAAE